MGEGRGKGVILPTIPVRKSMYSISAIVKTDDLIAKKLAIFHGKLQTILKNGNPN